MSGAAFMLLQRPNMPITPPADDPHAWTLDPRLSTVEFSAQHLGAPWVQGEFTHVTGRLRMERGRPLTASCNGELDTRRLVPREPRFNTQVRTMDVLDPEHHPKILFAGRLTEQTAERAYGAAAEITIRGFTQPLAMHAEYLGERTTPYLADGEHRGELTRVELKIQARLTREDLAASLQDRPQAARVVVASAFEITLRICAILDADLHATGAIEPLTAAIRAAPHA
jgi:polyisoprenoid-binding protein YceI